VEQLSTDCTELREEVLTQKAQITAMSPTVTPSPAALSNLLLVDSIVLRMLVVREINKPHDSMIF
jgi:hypothetical protein